MTIQIMSTVRIGDRSFNHSIDKSSDATFFCEGNNILYRIDYDGCMTDGIMQPVGKFHKDDSMWVFISTTGNEIETPSHDLLIAEIMIFKLLMLKEKLQVDENNLTL